MGVARAPCVIPIARVSVRPATRVTAARMRGGDRPPSARDRSIDDFGDDSSVACDPDPNRTVATGHEPEQVLRKMLLEPIAVEPPRRGRLQHDPRVHLGDELGDGRSPASVMRKLHDVGAQVHRSASGRGDETRRRFGLDVAREEDARDGRSVRAPEVDAHHERAVVETRGAERFRGPQDMPGRTAARDSVAGRDRPHRHAEATARIEQQPGCGHEAGALDERAVDDQFSDARVPHEVERGAVVVEVRMRDDDAVDAPAARGDHRKQSSRGDGAHAARARVEDRQFIARLDEIRRAVADREHRDRADVAGPVARGEGRDAVWPSRAREPCGDDQREHAPAREPPGPSSEAQRGHDRRHHQRREDRMRRAGRQRGTEEKESLLDQRDLKPREQLERPRRQRRDQFAGITRDRGPRRADDRLRIGDGERRGRDRSAREREQRSCGLQLPEVRERDRSARERRRDPRGDRARRSFAKHREKRRNARSSIVPRKHPQPVRADRRREVPEPEHACEAELEAGIDSLRRIDHEHRHDAPRDQSVGVPLGAAHRAERAQDRHQRRTGRARHRRHDEQRDRRRDAHSQRSQPLVADDEPERGGDEPAEHRQVESRDGEDVREPDRPERVLDGAVAVLGIAEDECDQHRGHRPVGSIRDAGDKRCAQRRTNPCARGLDRISKGRAGRPRVHSPAEPRRVERERPHDAARARRVRAVAADRKRLIAERAQRSDQAHARRDGPFGRRFKHMDGQQRAVSERDARAVVADHHRIAHEQRPFPGLLEMFREDVRAESPFDRLGGDGRLDHGELAFGIDLEDRHRRRAHDLRVAQRASEQDAAGDKHSHRPHGLVPRTGHRLRHRRVRRVRPGHEGDSRGQARDEDQRQRERRQRESMRDRGGGCEFRRRGPTDSVGERAA